MPNIIEHIPDTPFRENIWILPPHLQHGLPYLLYSTGITARDPSYHIVRDVGASYYVLECILDGEGTLIAAGQTLHPKAGDVYLLPKGVPNEYYTDKRHPWEKIWFNISGPLIDALVSCYHLEGLVYLRDCNMQGLFRRGMELVCHCAPDVQVEFATQMTRIFATLATLRGDIEEKGPAALLAQQMKTWLEEHWRHPYSLAGLSRACGKSPAQTMRLFSQAFHCTPKTYHTNNRLNAAQRYLEETGEQIKAIADWLGFANEFQFSAWFKKLTGTSPTQFRKTR